MPHAARVHVAAEEQHVGGAGRRLPGKDQRDHRADAPADEARFADPQRVHDGEHIGGHALVPVRLFVAGAAAAAVDHDGAIAAFDQRAGT
jgi:hypothetical protein